MVTETHALAERVLGLCPIRPHIPAVFFLFPSGYLEGIRSHFGRHDMGY